MFRLDVRDKRCLVHVNGKWVDMVDCPAHFHAWIRHVCEEIRQAGEQQVPSRQDE